MSCFTQLSMKFQLLIITKMIRFFALEHSNVVFIILINVEMSTNVGILTFMSKIKFNAQLS